MYAYVYVTTQVGPQTSVLGSQSLLYSTIVLYNNTTHPLFHIIKEVDVL